MYIRVWDTAWMPLLVFFLFEPSFPIWQIRPGLDKWSSG